MNARLASLALGLLAGIVFAGMTSLILGWAWPWARVRFARMHPVSRARALWLAAAAPGALPALVVALCFFPGLMAAAGIGADHCRQHPEHAHLCLIHASVPLTHAGIALLMLVATVLVAALVPEAVRWVRTRRWLERLPRRAAGLAEGVEIVESEAPFAFAAGLWRPRVLLAASLVEALPGPQLEVVVAHERAHARRRDPLARLAARLLSWPHLPSVRRALLGELTIASEEACDAEAARRVGDRLTVAEAILAVERILAGADPAKTGLAGFGGNSVETRVRALLAGERPAPVRRTAERVAAGLTLLVIPAFVQPLHHATEHLVALVARLL